MPTDHDIPKLIINKLTKEQYEQAVKNADELYLTPDDIQGLPDQTGQSGKYLTTDGASASWTTIPTINNSTITIQKNSTSVGSFTLNQSSNKNINITVPTKTSDITNDSGFLTSHQTIKTLNTDNTTTQTADDNENIVGSGTINLHKVSKTGSYNDLLDKPSIPTVNNATLTIQKNGTTVNTFTANSSTNVTANITVPTKTSDITNDSDFITSEDIPTKLSEFTDDLGSNPVHTHSQYITSHQTIKTLITNNTSAQTASSGESITGSGSINLHKVSKTGSYEDLLNKPTIPTVPTKLSEFTDDLGSSPVHTHSQYQTILSSTNKLNADYIQDGTTNKVVTATEKTTWNNKQNALSSQTAYTNKGSATKVPQITTNSLGQVTGITEVTITHPTEIPSQSGNSGKFLTTNGSTVSWATVDALPSQSGQSGKFLTTNGTTASWSESMTWTYNSSTENLTID